MADLKMLLDDAAKTLMDGDAAGALRLLSEAEKKARRRPELVDDNIAAGLGRLSELAHAAREGIADARALIVTAGGNARSLKTYDDKGNATPVANPRGALGRF